MGLGMSAPPCPGESSNPLAHPKVLWLAASVVTGTAIVWVFAQVVTHDFVNWDDPLYVVENPAVLAPGTVPWWHHLLTPSLGYPIPVTVATYLVERALFGLHPAVFHATNLLVHLAMALALLGLSRQIGASPVVAVCAVLLAALHPAAVEPVSWVSGRKEVLAGLLVVLAFLAAHKPLRTQAPSLVSRIPAATLLLLATLSKPSAAFVPVLFAAMDRPGRPLWLGQMVVHLVLVALGFHFQAEVGAVGEAGDLADIAARVLAVTGRHAGILLSPFDLAPKYIDPPDGPSWGILALGALVIAAFLAGLVRAVWTRHPSWPGLALALLTYLPSSGGVPLNRQYSDSYLYLPLIGLSLALAAWAGPVARRLSRPVRIGAVLAAILLVSGLGAVSATQARIWRNGVTLWTSLYARYPDSPQVCRNLGNAWMFGRNQAPERAAAVYRHCIETLGHRDFFLRNLAVATFHAGRRDEAASLFQEVLRAHPNDPVALKYLDRMDKSHTEQEGPWTPRP